MISFKESILITLFGGGIADYDMLEQCNYDFEDILNIIKGFTSIEEMSFNDILMGAIDLYRGNIENIIQDRIEQLKQDIDYLERRLEFVAYGKSDLYEIEVKKQELKDIEYLDTYNDIEYNTNYLDTNIWFRDDETKEIYKKYFENEIKEENNKIGFVELDLD